MKKQTMIATVLGIMLSTMSGGAHASQPQEAQDVSERPTLMARVQRDSTGADRESPAHWVWSRGRRLYYFQDPESGFGLRGFQTIVQMDADRMEIRSSRRLPWAGWASNVQGDGNWGGGEDRLMAVDEDNGRLAYFTMPYILKNAIRETTTYEEWAQEKVKAVSMRQIPCPTEATALPCAVGVGLLDAESLEPIRLLPLSIPENPHAVALPRAISFYGKQGAAGSKVLVLLEEHVHHPQAETLSPTINQPTSGGVSDQGFNVMWVAQLDVNRGTTDWTQRLDACRNMREPRVPERSELVALHHGNFVSRFNDSPQGTDSPDAVWVGCHGANQAAVMVRVPLDAEGMAFTAPVDLSASAAEGGGVAGGPALSPPTAAFMGPEGAVEILPDVLGRRFLVRSVKKVAGSDVAEVWWVFDVMRRNYVGTIGIGNTGYYGTDAALNPQTGRLYMFVKRGRKVPAGLYVVDTRRNPTPQAVRFDELASYVPTDSNLPNPLAVDVVPGGFPRLWLPDQHPRVSAGSYSVFEDRYPASLNSADAGFDGLTVDLEEVEGVTTTTLDGAARGFGARFVGLGGVEALARVGPVDPVGFARGAHWLANTQNGFPYYWAGTDKLTTPTINRYAPVDTCGTEKREALFGVAGASGAALLDADGARGSAAAVVLDDRTPDDLDRPVSRCSGRDWDARWADVAIGGQPPADEPSLTKGAAFTHASCLSGDAGAGETEQSSDAAEGDPVADGYSAAVECERDGAQGFGYVRAFSMGGVTVGEALSSFRVYRDPARGVVARVESVARGVAVPGMLKIQLVRGTAESWANGRKQPVAEQDRDPGYRANCDMDRTAGTCFSRAIFGVSSPGYSCGPCGDESALAAGLSRAMGANGFVRLRQPDPGLAHGAENGYIAAVQKDRSERMADLVLDEDGLQTVLPAIEIVRHAPGARPVPNSGTAPRGKQIYQFGGVEVASSYSIQCLLVYDKATNTCAGEKQEPGAIQVSLSDPDGKALAGGAFEVRADVDADGVLGLKDTLLPNGACVTTDDGVGTCKFENLQPGSYLVNQVAAPPGYAKSAEPFVVELASGEQRTVAFTNVGNLSTVELKATDENGQPVSGAVFAAYPDPDSDGKVAPDAKPAAECTTGADGACSMKVPAGSYVLVQTSAPAGLEGIEPVAFTFASGGQVAAVTVVNYPPEMPGAPEPEPAPSIDYTAPVDAMPPTEIVDDYVAPEVPQAPETVQPPVLAQVGDTITQVIRAPGDALRLLARDPKEAVAWTAALALLVLAVMAIRRRQMLATLGAGPAFATAGGGGRRPPSPGSATSAGPKGPPGPGGGRWGNVPSGAARGSSAGHDRPQSGATRQNLAGHAMSATAVLDRREVSGAAPAIGENVRARVVAGSASDSLMVVVRRKLAGSGHCELLAVAPTIEVLQATLGRVETDVLVLDLALLGDRDEAWVELPALHAAERIVGLIPEGRGVEEFAIRAYQAGIGGLLVAFADMGNGQLSYAVRCVASGKPFYGPTVQSIMLDQGGGHRRGRRGRSLSLTAREVEVARLAAEGMKRNAIAEQLFLSPLTVKRHLHSVRSKLGVTNPWDLEQLRSRLDEHLE